MSVAALFEIAVETAPERIRELGRKARLEDLEEWIRICNVKSSKHPNYWMVFQDLVNILGERLGFQVVFGNYRKGPDGIWRYGGSEIVVEVKSSAAFFNPEELRKFVMERGAGSGLAICPEFTNDKIAAVRGGYPEIRLITTNGLCRLVRLREQYQVPTEHIINLLMPQEGILLDNIIDLVSGIAEATAQEEVEEPAAPPAEEDRLNIDEVPPEIRGLGDVSKAMYIVLSRNPGEVFNSTRLAKEIKRLFPKTFKDRSIASIAYGTIWAGESLEKRGLIEIERYRPEPEKHPTWIRRRYMIKKKL
ncbi:hypothetical protein CW705_06920 [Candidatus Bathyarchaeota archaeon]|nr:MAG: hypothetical protein CW705_06920 [Candidatus Bathyarchaeota archaeon]